MKIMVLNDGETFTALDGCKIVDVDGGIDTDTIETALKEDAVTVVQSFSDPPRAFTVIGVYDDSKYDDGRFAEAFEAVSAHDAESKAESWAQPREIIIAGTVAGDALVG